MKQDQDLGLNDILGQADETFRKSLAAVNQWTEQFGDALEKKPGAVLAGIAMAGFLVGSIFRGKSVEKRRNPAEFAKDSAFLFVAGTVAGIVAAPFFKDEIELQPLGLNATKRDFGPH